MKLYTYSEARQNLARLLSTALSDGEVRIRRKDGSEFTVQPVAKTVSPLDVPGIDLHSPVIDIRVTAEDILAAIREERGRE